MKAILTILLFFLSQTALAGFIIYGEDYSFMITEPKGWVADIESGRGQGANVVLYEEGQTWAKAPVVMYVNVIDKSKGTVAEIIAHDSQSFKRECPAIKILPFSISGPKGRLEAKAFDCPAQNYEVVSYLNVGGKVCLLVISGRLKTLVDSKLAAYRDLVKSFTWLTSNVRIKR